MMLFLLTGCAAPWTLGAPAMDIPPPVAVSAPAAAPGTHTVKRQDGLSEAASAFVAAADGARVGLTGEGADIGEAALLRAGAVVVEMQWGGVYSAPADLVIETGWLPDGRAQAKVIRRADGRVVAVESGIAPQTALKRALRTSAGRL